MLAHVLINWDSKDVFFFKLFAKVNGVDTIRVPVKVLPYEDPSAEAKRMLKTLRLEAEAAEASPETATSDDEAAASPEPLPEQNGQPTENRPKD